MGRITSRGRRQRIPGAWPAWLLIGLLASNAFGAWPPARVQPPGQANETPVRLPGSTTSAVWRTLLAVASSGMPRTKGGADAPEAGDGQPHRPSAPLGAVRAREPAARGADNAPRGLLQMGEDAPVIVTQPANATNTAGTKAMFSVRATGTGLGFQWRKRGVNLADGGNIAGSFTTALAVFNVTASDVGGYDVIVSNVSGCVTSAVAVLTVSYDPTVDFSILNGNPNGVWSYGWMTTAFTSFTLYSNTNMINGSPVWWGWNTDYTPNIWRNQSGSTQSGVQPGQLALHPGNGAQPSVLRWVAPVTCMCRITGQFFAGDSGIMAVGVRAGTNWLWQASDAGAFDISTPLEAGSPLDFVVSGGYGFGSTPLAVTSLVWNVVGPVILTPPVSCTNDFGSTATFSVGTFGTAPLNYQWRKGGVNLVAGGLLAGTDTATLTVSNVSGSAAGEYDVIVSNAYGSVTSAVAILTVRDPVINVQPVSQNALWNSNVTFNVTAAGTELSYQWRQNGVGLSGATNATLTLSNLQDSAVGDYDALVCGSFGCVTSAVAVLTIEDPVVQPVSQVGQFGSNITFSVTAVGSALSYQWRKNGLELPGAAGTSLTLTNLQGGVAGNYDVIVCGSYGCVTSTAATLTVLDPNINVQPESQAVYPGHNITFSVTVAGTGPLGYQ